jgi:hypothetical protein
LTLRAPVSFVVCLAVFAANGLGLHTGMVLQTYHHGQLTLVAPLLNHALAHAHGADHHPADQGRNADHRDLHHLVAVAADADLGTGKSDRADPSADAAPHYPAALDFSVPATITAAAFRPRRAALAAADHRGGTARTEMASLRAIVLLV